MNRDTKKYIKSKLNGYANKFYKRNKVDDSSIHLVIKAFKSAFMLSYQLFMNRDNFWESRYWILNGVYVKAMEADAEYLGKLKKENEELKVLVDKLKYCAVCEDDDFTGDEITEDGTLGDDYD